MGCCQSAESSLYAGEQGNRNSSSLAITESQSQSQANIPRPSTHASHDSSRPHHPQQDLTSHLNKRLKRHVWTSKKTWTNGALEKERREFFETRVTGREEIWQTIHGTLQVLWSGGDDGDADGGLETAQSILSAADITIPTGDLAQGAYDGFGAFYQLPEHIVSNPTNMSVVTTRESEEEDKIGGDGSESPDEEVLRRRAEKGKAVVRPQDMISVRVKLSDREEPPKKFSVSKKEPIQQVVGKIVEEINLPDNKHIKIVYLGKVLKPNKSLIEQGWRDNHVVNGLVLEKL